MEQWLSRERAHSLEPPASPGPPTANPRAGSLLIPSGFLFYLEPEEPLVFFPKDGSWPLVTVA